MRAWDRALGCCSGPATAASRWRPPGLVGVAWRGVEASSARARAARKLGRDAWKLAGRRWRWGGGPERWAARRHAGGAEQRSREGRRKVDSVTISEISRDQTVKQR